MSFSVIKKIKRTLDILESLLIFIEFIHNQTPNKVSNNLKLSWMLFIKSSDINLYKLLNYIIKERTCQCLQVIHRSVILVWLTPVMIVKWIAKIIDIFNPILPPSNPSQIILNISREIAGIGIQLWLIGQNLVSN